MNQSSEMRRSGFTLLEVMVALMVFAVAAVALAAAYVNVLNAYDVVNRGNDNLEDIRFARSMLLAEPDRQKAEDGADFETADGGRIRWTTEIEATTVADLFRVTFICEIAESAGKASPSPRRETFFLLRPTWSEGDDAAKLREEAKTRIVELKQQRTP